MADGFWLSDVQWAVIERKRIFPGTSRERAEVGAC